MGPLQRRQQPAFLFNPTRRTFRAMLAFCVGLAVFLSLAFVQAASPAVALAQTSAYDDADGRFAVNLPDSFTDETAITYEMLGDNPLDMLVASNGVVISEPDTPNGVSVLFLLLDESISDWDEFAAFIATFQVAAGGDTLPLVDFEPVAGEEFVAYGNAATRDRQLQVQIEADGDIVSILSTSVDRTRYRELRSALEDVFDSYTWSPDVVALSLGQDSASEEGDSAEGEAEDQSGEDEQTVDEEPEGQEAETDAGSVDGVVPEPAGQDASSAGSEALPETERFFDPAGVFSLEVPAELQPSELRDSDHAAYGYGFWYEDQDDAPVVAAWFAPAAFAADGSTGAPEFQEVDDELWNQFVDTFLAESATGMEVYAEQRNDYYHTAFFVLNETESTSDTPGEMWVWLEESDGMGAALIVIGDEDDPLNPALFHTALTTFNWTPAAAAREAASLAGVTDPAQAPVGFEDPFGLVELATPPDYPFQASYFEDEAIQYTFGRNPIDGLIQLSLSAPGDGPFNSSGWSLVVDETERSVMETLSDGSLGPNARQVEKSVGEPQISGDNTALVVARTDAYWMAVILVDFDGVLASEVIIVPDAWWQDHEDFMVEAVNRGITFDPDEIRDAIEASRDIGAYVLETGTAGRLPSSGGEIDWRYSFEPDDSFTVAVDFTEPGLDGSLKVIVIPDSTPDYPLAQYAQWLGADEYANYGTMTSQEETGTRAAFTYTPDYPLTPGEYTAYLYYNNSLVAANGFTVKDSPPESTGIANFAPSYGDVLAGEPLLVSTAIHTGDLVTVRGTVDLPAGSQLRLFWYDPDNWLDTGEVGTIRLDSSFHSPYDWLYFEPEVDWRPGTYSYLLTVDGEPFADGQLVVVEDTEEVALTQDGGEIFDALPLPAELIVAPADESFDIAIAPSETYPSEDVISTVDAWLRMQDWQPALPPMGAPVAWDYRRWVKDGYQFVLQPGTDGAEDEIWMRIAPASDSAFGPVPSGAELEVDSLSVMEEVAQLDIEGLDAAQAAISPDGNWLAVTTTDGTLYIFDALRLMDTIWWQPDGFYANPVFSPNSRDIAVTVDGQNRSEVQLFSNFDVIWLPTTTFRGHSDAITAIDYQSDGWLATGGSDGAFRQWEPVGEYLPIMVDADGPVSGLAAAPEDEPGLVIAREGGAIEYRLDGGDVAWSDGETENSAPRIAVWSSFDENGAGDFAAYGGGQVEWFIYDTDNVDLFGSAPVDDEEFQSTGAAFSPNGAILGISGETVQFYDRSDGTWLGEWEVVVNGERVSVSALGISPDGQYVIVVTDDGMMRLWAVTAQ